MRRVVLTTVVLFVLLVAAAIAAAPTATVDEVTATSIKLGSLTCNTPYRIRLQTVNPDGTFSETQAIRRTTAACPTPDPTPPPSGTEPAPIAGQGYHEVFHDDFNTLDRTVWDYCIWYDCPSDPVSWASTRQVVDSSGILHIKAFKPYPYLNTITTQTSGKTFQYGYFEVRMKWPKGNGSWPAFWLYSYQHAIDQNQCTTQAGEIDVMEGQGSEPNVFYGTVHSNTNGCSPSDQQNDNNWQPTGMDLTAAFHTYGLKWTPTTVTWYLDGVQTHSAPTYTTDNQPMFLLLQEWDGGWTKNPDSTTPDPLDDQIDKVSVWQQ